MDGAARDEQQLRFGIEGGFAGVASWVAHGHVLAGGDNEVAFDHGHDQAAPGVGVGWNQSGCFPVAAEIFPGKGGRQRPVGEKGEAHIFPVLVVVLDLFDSDVTEDFAVWGRVDEAGEEIGLSGVMFHFEGSCF